MPDLAALEVLVAVARSESLNTAAAQLGRTQQAVSARIASIERQTGVAMVVRTTRGSTLTPAGVVVAEWAARLLDTAAELEAGLGALRHDRQAQLRVAASLTIADQLLPGWLVALNAGPRRCSAILSSANSDVVAEQVRTGTVDLGFVEGPRAPRGCRSRVIAHDDLVVVVPPTHPWASRRAPLSPQQLAATSLVVREAGSGTRQTLAAALLATSGQDLAAPVLELSTTAAIRAAVQAGAGPAVLSSLVVADDVAAGRLRLVAVAGLDLRRSLRALWLGVATPPAGPIRDLVGIAGAAGAGWHR